MDINNLVTVVCVTVVTCVALNVLGGEAKEIAIAAVSGLVGFLTGKALSNVS